MVSLHHNAPEELDLHNFSKMKIRDFEKSLEEGYRYVVFYYVMSAFVYSFVHPTKIITAKSKKELLLRSLPYTLLTLLLGWWSIYGFFYTLKTIYGNLTGGTDVSTEIREHIKSQDPRYQYGMI